MPASLQAVAVLHVVLAIFGAGRGFYKKRQVALSQMLSLIPLA
ncbi:MAG: hypothetical protein U1D35_18780 [Paracoccaceae bacterium]|nr:hypothetical protein [Paracoccaceae bacterium]